MHGVRLYGNNLLNLNGSNLGKWGSGMGPVNNSEFNIAELCEGYAREHAKKEQIIDPVTEYHNILKQFPEHSKRIAEKLKGNPGDYKPHESFIEDIKRLDRERNAKMQNLEDQKEIAETQYEELKKSYRSQDLPDGDFLYRDDCIAARKRINDIKEAMAELDEEYKENVLSTERRIVERNIDNVKQTVVDYAFREMGADPKEVKALSLLSYYKGEDSKTGVKSENGEVELVAWIDVPGFKRDSHFTSVVPFAGLIISQTGAVRPMESIKIEQSYMSNIPQDQRTVETYFDDFIGDAFIPGETVGALIAISLSGHRKIPIKGGHQDIEYLFAGSVDDQPISAKDLNQTYYGLHVGTSVPTPSMENIMNYIHKFQNPLERSSIANGKLIDNNDISNNLTPSAQQLVMDNYGALERYSNEMTKFQSNIFSPVSLRSNWLTAVGICGLAAMSVAIGALASRCYYKSKGRSAERRTSFFLDENRPFHESELSCNPNNITEEKINLIAEILVAYLKHNKPKVGRGEMEMAKELGADDNLKKRIRIEKNVENIRWIVKALFPLTVDQLRKLLKLATANKMKEFDQLFERYSPSDKSRVSINEINEFDVNEDNISREVYSSTTKPKSDVNEDISREVYSSTTEPKSKNKYYKDSSRPPVQVCQ